MPHFSLVPASTFCAAESYQPSYISFWVLPVHQPPRTGPSISGQPNHAPCKQLPFPCRRDGGRRCNVHVDHLILIEPTHWRPWDEMRQTFPRSVAGVSADQSS